MVKSKKLTWGFSSGIILAIVLAIFAFVVLVLYFLNNGGPNFAQNNLYEIPSGRTLNTAEISCVQAKLGPAQSRQVAAYYRANHSFPTDINQIILPCFPKSTLTTNPGQPTGSNSNTNNGNSSTGTVGTSTTLSGTAYGADNIVPANNGVSNASLINQMGIKVNTVWLYTDNFTQRNTAALNTNQLTNYINSFAGVYGSGVQLTIHVMPPRQINCTSCLPQSLPANMSLWDSNLTLIAQTLKGKIKYYSIGNEVTGITWTGSPNDYYNTLLPQSYNAIKAGDPSAIVLDGAQASETYGLVIGQDYVNKGQVDQAVNFINSFYQNHAGPIQHYLPVTSGNINTLLTSSLAQDAIPYSAPRFNSATCKFFDQYELHYYAPWSMLGQTIGWINNQMQSNGCEKPIQIWELGYGWDNSATYNISDHAQAVAKVLTIASLYNLPNIIYFPLYSRGTYAQPLISTTRANQPATAYQVTVGKLYGATKSSLVNVQNSNASVFQFLVANHPVYVAWSTSPTTVTLPLPGQVTVTDIAGKTSTTNATGISLSSSPVFISQ